MNEKVKPDGGEYRFDTAELVYCRAFSRYVRDYCGPAQISERVNELVAELVRARGLDVRAAFDARERLANMLVDHREFFSFFRPKFFMLDVWPENARRFKLTYDDCVKLAATEVAESSDDEPPPSRAPLV